MPLQHQAFPWWARPTLGPWSLVRPQLLMQGHEAVAAIDPTLENLEKIAAELREADDRDRALYATFVQQFIDKNYDPRELPKLMRALQTRRAPGCGTDHTAEADLRAIESEAAEGSSAGSASAERGGSTGPGGSPGVSGQGDWNWSD
jgi:hypothetical protein